MAELKSAYAAQDPILMMIWQPHWIFADLDLNFVEWNPVEGECIEETQQKETACGFQQAAVHKVVWGGFEAKWPAAFKMVSNFKLTNEDEAQFSSSLVSLKFETILNAAGHFASKPPHTTL